MVDYLVKLKKRFLLMEGRPKLKLIHKFKEFAEVQVRDGKTYLFWKD
jgi:hypothetical protein